MQGLGCLLYSCTRRLTDSVKQSRAEAHVVVIYYCDLSALPVNAAATYFLQQTAPMFFGRQGALVENAGVQACLIIGACGVVCPGYG